MAERGMRVLVCGATGYLGRHVVKCAHENGHWVRALARNEGRLGDERAACHDVFVGHATKPETLAGLCDDIDVVISSLGNRTMKRKPDCFDVDYGANINILHRAREAGVAHFIFVAVLDGRRMRKTVPQLEARERVVDELAKGDMPYTIIRPSGFFNDMSEILEMARKGTVWIPTGAGSFNPIHGADLAEVCVGPIGDESALGAEIPAGGPDVVTMRRIAELAFEALDEPPKIRTFPPWILDAAAAVIKPFNVNVASLLLMFSAMIGNEGDSVCDGYGTHHLADFFAELVANATEGAVAVRSGG